MRVVQMIELLKGGINIMAFNYDKLKGRITEVFGAQYKFAEAMKMSDRTLSIKLNNGAPWKQSDICKAVLLLKLNDSDIPKDAGVAIEYNIPQTSKRVDFLILKSKL